MGRETFSRTAFVSAVRAHTEKGKSSTTRGEQAVKKTGKLAPLVDPAEYGVIRPSRVRLEEMKDGRFKMTVGMSVPIEYRLDTTGSMGDNVERALKALPSICEFTSSVLPGRDPHYCASIFGDIQDLFVLCRGQFEMIAEKMVDQLTLMHPEHGGGDEPEDPHYGLFGAAYLTNAYFQRIGMKSYDFTVTDAPARDRLVLDYLKRVFGPSVIDKVRENGHTIEPKDLPTSKEVARDLLKRTHAFCLVVGDGSSARSYWKGLYGADRVVVLPSVDQVAHVMATIIGLTEGELDLKLALDFLTKANLKKAEARQIVDAVSGIPLGAQRSLPNFGRIPKKGDIFAKKTDIWPVESGGENPTSNEPASVEDGGWL